MVKQVKEDFSFVSEDCNVCGKEMTDERYIYVDEELDLYLCKICKDRYNIKVVRCKELGY